jgi:hypothetical protein
MNVVYERSTVRRKDSSNEARKLWWSYYELLAV